MSKARGDLLSISCQHPTLGSRVFEMKAGEDYNYQPGGFKTSDDDGNISTTGEHIAQKTRYPWSFSGTLAYNSGDQEYLQSLSNDTVPAVWTFTEISGRVRKGKGIPVGDIEENANAGTLPLTLKGSKKLETIS